MKKYLFTLALLTIGQVLFAQYQVGHTTITFNDPQRTGGFGSGGGSGRQIQTEIYYPTDVAGEDVPLTAGTFPVVVFGHGFAMSWDAYENIWNELAPKGYIIAFPRTEGSLFPAPSHEDFGLDLALVNEAIQNENGLSTSLFFSRVSEKSAIVGHSMGGGAAFLAAENNTNITTVIGLAPAETTPSAIASASNVTVPALVFSADEDFVTPAADHHTPIYNGLSSSCKYFVNILGGAHCYYANSNFNCDFGESSSGGNISISRAEQQTILYRYLIPWLDLYLYDNCDQNSVFETDLSLDSEVSYVSSCSGFPSLNFDLNVSIAASTLTSAQTGGVYQWIDCDNGNTAILGANNQSYTATSVGNYAVVLGSGSCADTSDCYLIDAVGINDLLSNPEKELVKVVDVMGRVTDIKANTPLIFIYSDGTTKRVMKIEE